jgi:hypothetical protein
VRAGNARAGMAGSAAAALVGPLAQSLADPHGGGRGVHHRGRTQLFGLRAGRGRAAQGAAYRRKFFLLFLYTSNNILFSCTETVIITKFKKKVHKNQNSQQSIILKKHLIEFFSS